jgi:hypothetical protein
MQTPAAVVAAGMVAAGDMAAGDMAAADMVAEDTVQVLAGMVADTVAAALGGTAAE